MASYFRTRRSVYINISLLFLLVAVWCLAYMKPVLSSFFKENHLFYGRVSYAAIPSLFGGSNIPFLDKTYFQLNGDAGATFVLYASQNMNEEMSVWFNFAGKDAENIPVEVTAARVSEKKFVVTSMSTVDGDLDEEALLEYHVYNAAIGLGIVLVSVVGMLVFLILGIRSKR